VSWGLVRQASRRLSWGVADQAMSSLTNFLLSIYVVRTLGAMQFGAFSLAYVTYGFAINASRGLAIDPILIRFSGTDLPTWRRAAASCAGTALAMGLVTGTCALAAGLLLGGTTGRAFLALGLTLPGLLLQDSWRYAFFALGRGHHAFINDTVWAVILFPSLALLHASGHGDVFSFVLAWGGAAVVGAAIFSLQARVLPSLAGVWEWLWRHRDIGPRYLAVNSGGNAAEQLRTYAVSYILGIAAVGYIQAARTLMGPFMVIFFGMSLIAIPEAAQLLRRSPRHLPVFCAAVSAGLTLLGLAWGVALLVALPRGLGHLMLGNIWRPVYPLVLPATIYVMSTCATIGAGMGMLALGAARRSLRATIITGVLIVACALIGALTGGTLGTMRFTAAGSWAGTLVSWWQLRQALLESDTVPVPAWLWPGRSGHSKGRKLKSVIVFRRRPRVASLSPAQARDRSIRRRVGAAWALLYFNTLTFVPGSILPIPSFVGTGLAQGALPLALLVALTVNPKVRLRPNVFLCVVSLLLVDTAIVCTSARDLGTVYLSFRLAEFVAVLWLLTPWWGRDDMLLLWCHLRCLLVALGSVLVGLLIVPGHALAAQDNVSAEGRLSGVIWPMVPTQVAQYAAVAAGVMVVLWLGRLLSGRATLAGSTVAAAILLLTHTRTALAAVVAGIVVAGLSLFTVNARVRKFFAVAAAATSIGIISAAGVLTTWLARGENAQGLASLSGRTNFWALVLDEPRTRFQEIFGFGLSSAGIKGLPIDSNWLASYQMEGLFGVVVCAVMLAWLFANAFFQPHGVRRALALFLLTYCTLASYTEVGFTDASTYLLYLTVVASLLIVPGQRQAISAPSTSPAGAGMTNRREKIRAGAWSER
jgi:O-antigen/teichoic acid export membrane protein